MNKILNEPYKSWVLNSLYTLLYKALNSTNYTAIALMAEGKIAGPTAIISESQKKGRGQLQTKWHSSSKKNLTFSLAIPKFSLNVQEQFKVNKAVCLALLEQLKPYASEFKIKWPNDIYYKKKKVAGVLIENQLQGNTIKSCVIGIGLNVNETDWPNNIPNPISLKEILQKELDINRFQQQLPSQFYNDFIKFLEFPLDNINQLYAKNLLGINQWQTFEANQIVFKGKIIGTNAFGNLAVENEKGEVEHFPIKQIRFIF